MMMFIGEGGRLITTVWVAPILIISRNAFAFILVMSHRMLYSILTSINPLRILF